MTLWHSIYCSTQASLSFTVSRSLLTFFPANDESVLIQDGYWSILSAIQCPLSWWCYLTVLSSATPFFFCLQSFPASGTFPMSQFFASGGQSNGASASASVLPMNIQDWFPLAWTGLISCWPRDSQESSSAPQFESINSLAPSLHYGPTLTSVHEYWKIHSFD